MIVIGHRGAPQKEPENSQAGLKAAMAEGAWGVELDVQLSLCGKLYTCHDDQTARTTSHQIMISQNDHSALAKVHLENSETLPTLRAMLETWLSTSLLPHLNLEIKTQDPRWVNALHQLLKSLNTIPCIHKTRPSPPKPAVSAGQLGSYNEAPRKSLIISSSHIDNLAHLLTSPLSAIPRALLWPPLSSGTPYIPSADRFIEYRRIRSALKKAQTHILHPEASYWISAVAGLAQLAAADNLEIYTWSPLRFPELSGNHQLWKKLVALAVSGHCTNYPLELHRFLRRGIIPSPEDRS